MNQRSTFLWLPLLTAASLLAQEPFTYDFRSPASNDKVSCTSFDRIGPDHYRVCGILRRADTAWVYRAEMDADATISNVSLSAPDIAHGPTTFTSLNTQDGGQLLNYYYSISENSTFWRTNAQGTVLWVRHYAFDNGYRLASWENTMVEKDGHYFVLANLQDFPGNTYSSVLLELDGTGACVQTRAWASEDVWAEFGRGICRTSDNGLLTTSILRPNYTTAFYPKISVQRWDPSLQVQWSKLYTLGGDHYLTQVQLLHDNGLLLMGSVSLVSNSGPYLPFIMRLDSAGQVLWTRFMPYSPTSVVEEDDGGFTVLFHTPNAQLTIASLDSAGALISANASINFPWTNAPYGITRDTVTGEYLVRAQLVPTAAYVVRLDSALHIGCDHEPITWTDSLVAPQVTDLQVTMHLGTLPSTDTTWSVSTASLIATDLCSTTSMSSAQPEETGVKAWPVPVENLLHIDIGQAVISPVPYRVMDMAWRTVQSGSALPDGQGRFELDVSSLSAGCHLVLLELPSGPVRLSIVK